MRAALSLFIFVSVFVVPKETQASPLNAADNDMIENIKAVLNANKIDDPQFLKRLSDIQTGNSPTGRSYSDIMEQLKEYFEKYADLMSSKSGSGFQAFMGR